VFLGVVDTLRDLLAPDIDQLFEVCPKLDQASSEMY